jgi:hypothetical protein
MVFQDRCQAGLPALSIGECAEIARVKRDEIHTAMIGGRLPWRRMAGKRVVDPPDLRRWMARRQQGGFGGVR